MFFSGDNTPLSSLKPQITTVDLGVTTSNTIPITAYEEYITTVLTCRFLHTFRWFKYSCCNVDTVSWCKYVQL